MGDGIMAFWGAPATSPTTPCGRAAPTPWCAGLRGLQEGWWRGSPLDHRIGINSGVMIVGNVGSKQRFDYTAVGDAVNLAPRLEEANKEYRTTIIVGDGPPAVEEFALRSLDLIALRGLTRRRPSELLGSPGADGLLPAGYLASWEEASRCTARDATSSRRPAETFERCLGRA